MVGENLIFSSPPTVADNKNNLDGIQEIKANINNHRLAKFGEIAALTKTTPPRQSMVAHASPLQTKAYQGDF